MQLIASLGNCTIIEMTVEQGIVNTTSAGATCSSSAAAAALLLLLLPAVLPGSTSEVTPLFDNSLCSSATQCSAASYLVHPRDLHCQLPVGKTSLSISVQLKHVFATQGVMNCQLDLLLLDCHLVPVHHVQHIWKGIIHINRVDCLNSPTCFLIVVRHVGYF